MALLAMSVNFPQILGEHVYKVGGDSDLSLLRTAKVCCPGSLPLLYLRNIPVVYQRYCPWAPDVSHAGADLVGVLESRLWRIW